MDDLGAMVPGMARLMDELSRRYWVLYYAAKASNWELARYEWRESRTLLGIMRVVRPKYARDLEAFDSEVMAEIGRTLEAEDFDAFDRAYREGIAASDRYHAKLNKGFIRFRLPARPPDWIDVTPR